MLFVLVWVVLCYSCRWAGNFTSTTIRGSIGHQSPAWIQKRDLKRSASAQDFSVVNSTIFGRTRADCPHTRKDQGSATNGSTCEMNIQDSISSRMISWTSSAYNFWLHCILVCHLQEEKKECCLTDNCDKDLMVEANLCCKLSRGAISSFFTKTSDTVPSQQHRYPQSLLLVKRNFQRGQCTRLQIRSPV